MLGSVPFIKNNDAVIWGERTEGVIVCLLFNEYCGEKENPDFFIEGFFIEITDTYLFSQRALGLKPRPTAYQVHTKYMLLNFP